MQYFYRATLLQRAAGVNYGRAMENGRLLFFCPVISIFFFFFFLA